MPAPIVFRCTANPRIGMGHLNRCREMARVFRTRGHDCHIFGLDDALSTPNDAALFKSWTAYTETAPSAVDAAEVVALCRTVKASHLVLDDYRGADMAYQTILAEAGLRWLQQFDSSKTDSFIAPILVNAGPFERPEHFQNRVSATKTQMLFGPRYAVLRPEFAGVTPQPDARPVRRILVAFGGGNDRGAIDLFLKASTELQGSGISLRIISGRNNPNNADLIAKSKNKPQIELLIDPPEMAKRIAECDLGCIAGGTMSYELAYCGVPMMLVAMAPNQERSCVGWQNLTGAPYIGQIDTITDQDINAALGPLLAQDGMRLNLTAKGRAQVDCLGAERLCDSLLAG